MEQFSPVGRYAPSLLPPALAQAMTPARPVRTPGSQPRAVVVLVEFDVQPLEVA